MSNVNVKNQMLNVNKVKLLSERTSGVPPVIFNLIKFLMLTVFPFLDQNLPHVQCGELW